MFEDPSDDLPRDADDDATEEQPAASGISPRVARPASRRGDPARRG